jgi:hypothetical protein
LNLLIKNLNYNLYFLLFLILVKNNPIIFIRMPDKIYISNISLTKLIHIRFHILHYLQTKLQLEGSKLASINLYGNENHELESALITQHSIYSC